MRANRIVRLAAFRPRPRSAIVSPVREPTISTVSLRGSTSATGWLMAPHGTPTLARRVGIAYRSRPRQVGQRRSALRRGGIKSRVGDEEPPFNRSLVEAHRAPGLPYDSCPPVGVVRAGDERDPDRDHRHEDKRPRNNACCAQRGERGRAESKEPRQRDGSWTPPLAHDAGASGRVLRHVRPRVRTT
jgi:hypothetical protein